jgi:hypothetical protein
MTQTKSAALCAALAMIVTTGCVQNHGTFSVLSNRGVDVRNIDLDAPPRATDVEGRAVAHTVLLFFPIGPGTSPNRALDDALTNGPGDLMTNAHLRSWRWSIIVYSQSGWSVRGDVLDSRQQ